MTFREISGETIMRNDRILRLHALAKRVEALDDDVDGEIDILLGWIDPGERNRNWTPYGGDDRYPRLTGSIDAAFAFLPPWAIPCVNWDDREQRYNCQLVNSIGKPFPLYHGNARQFAHAILSAGLRAWAGQD